LERVEADLKEKEYLCEEDGRTNMQKLNTCTIT